MVILYREIFIFYKKSKKIDFFICIFILGRAASTQYNAIMYRDVEDIEEIARLDEERVRLLVENRELKKKLERKKDKIQELKRRVEGLTKALSQTGSNVDHSRRIQYEKEQRLDKEKELDEWIKEQEEKARLGLGRF